jgi:hypothetical protein
VKSYAARPLYLHNLEYKSYNTKINFNLKNSSHIDIDKRFPVPTDILRPVHCIKVGVPQDTTTWDDLSV